MERGEKSWQVSPKRGGAAPAVKGISARVCYAHGGKEQKEGFKRRPFFRKNNEECMDFLAYSWRVL